MLAAGHDDASRELLSRPLGDATVVELAVANVRRVVDAGRIVVVVSPDDPTVRELLGEDVVYVEQESPLGTGDAVLAAREASRRCSGRASTSRSSSPTRTRRCCAPSRCSGC
ncbi:hypothetical protein IU11_11770 [Cellulosimicrobium sp. MM]|nr:hypothetical protein [Cellulosimicrobium sp. MM]KFD43392.1 hypothetical protein IU11_11770 [Cellulosimicrobium sp. MM]